MPETKSSKAFGFLTVVSGDQFGHTGGYLLLNPSGRPLEFHCTAPVKPNRAQEILYGPTLLPYLYGEQIAQTLVGRGSVEPLAVFTDVAPVLAVREFLQTPLVLVSDASASEVQPDAAARDGATWRIDRGCATGAPLQRFHWSVNELALADHLGEVRQRVLDHLAQASISDLAEPFGRIREAIAEAHRGRGADARSTEP